MRASMLVGRFVGAALLSVSATASAQTAGGGGQPPPASRVSMDDAVRLALERNHQLRAQRLNVDISKADEITAALKPNPLLTSTNENFPIFSPGELFSSDNFLNNQNFVENLSYLFERGGKRKSRTLVAQDTTTIADRTTLDAERQLVFRDPSGIHQCPAGTVDAESGA